MSDFLQTRPLDHDAALNNVIHTTRSAFDSRDQERSSLSWVMFAAAVVGVVAAMIFGGGV